MILVIKGDRNDKNQSAGEVVVSTNPSEEYDFVNWDEIPNWKNIPFMFQENHQPVLILSFLRQHVDSSGSKTSPRPMTLQPPGGLVALKVQLSFGLHLQSFETSSSVFSEDICFCWVNHFPINHYKSL